MSQKRCLAPWKNLQNRPAFDDLKIGKVGFLTKLRTKLAEIPDPLFGALANRAQALLGGLRTIKMCFVAGTMVHCANAASGEMYLLPIEQVREGQLVWSRDEKTGELGIKKVIDTFVTNPSELFHLNIDVNGNSESDETLTGTGEHPFYLTSRPEEGFFPMRELLAGDSLVLASGKSAQVLSLKTERGPPKRPFTTYNFEVEDFHTYFAGESGVWVHNTGRGPCELIFSIYRNFRKWAGGNETQWDSLISARNAMRDDGFDLVSGTGPLSGTIIPGVYWRQTVKEVNDEMFGEVASGGMSLQKLPSHKQITDEFKGSGIGSTAPKRLNDPDALESHHIVEKRYQTRLGLTGSMTGDDIPGFITTYTQHRAGGTTPVSIASQLTQRIGSSTDPLTISTALRDTYLDHGLDDVWQVTKKYLQGKGVPTP